MSQEESRIVVDKRNKPWNAEIYATPISERYNVVKGPNGRYKLRRKK